jgi:hypothetical protein
VANRPRLVAERSAREMKVRPSLGAANGEVDRQASMDLTAKTGVSWSTPTKPSLAARS